MALVTENFTGGSLLSKIQGPLGNMLAYGRARLLGCGQFDLEN